MVEMLNFVFELFFNYKAEVKLLESNTMLLQMLLRCTPFNKNPLPTGPLSFEDIHILALSNHIG
jgi:hypothetical protein